MKGTYYKLTEKEIKILLKENLVILYDTREHDKKNQHILDFFDKNNITYSKQKIDEGDYTAIITKREEFGVFKDLYFKVAIERKNGVDEFVGNLCEETDSRDDIRLIRELERAKHKDIMMFMIIEDKNTIEKIEQAKYRSKFKPSAVLGRLDSISIKFLNGVEYVDKEDTGKRIYRKLYYSIRHFLGNGEIDILPDEIEKL